MTEINIPGSSVYTSSDFVDNPEDADFSYLRVSNGTSGDWYSLAPGMGLLKIVSIGSVKMLESSVLRGTLVKISETPPLPPVPINLPRQKTRVNIGGAIVTRQQLADAIAVLEAHNKQSVKIPLAKVHAAYKSMDYLGAAKETRRNSDPALSTKAAVLSFLKSKLRQIS